MDPFWAITLSIIAISIFWKRENRKSDDRKHLKDKDAERIEKLKQEEVIAQFTEAIQPEPLTPEEKEAERVLKEEQKQREKDIADLKKQGFTDELITTIIPTINNGQ